MFIALVIQLHIKSAYGRDPEAHCDLVRCNVWALKIQRAG